MSRIADALKRAKAAQQTAPERDSTAIPYQQADPKSAPSSGKGVIVPVGLLLLTVAALIAVWLGFRKGNSAAPIAATAAVPPAAAPNTTPAVPQSAPAASLEATPVTVTPVVASPTTVQTAADLSPVAAPKTSEPVAEPAPQNPPPLRLQAIFFSPSRPWAMIGGKTLFVGDQVGDFKVVAIASESATLVSGGQTNILTVSQ